MKQNTRIIKKVGGLGLAGVLAFGASTAMAEEFTASANVSSALAITIVNDLNFGDIFAATASSGSVDSLVMSPAGVFTNGTLDTGPTGDVKLLSLGGTIQPAQGTVATSNDFTLTLPEHIDDTGGIAGKTGVTELTIAGGDPAVAKLLVANFTVGQLTSATEGSNNLTGITEGTARTYTINPDFAATEVGFNMGATIYTDDGQTTATERVEYEDGVYSGTFTVTAEF
ncbi:hypothetical protein [Marinobacter sp. CHS3-4]|uniref:hypothetical protein n=1 Tax=Marinobacter sp. CHS3-4 TaxID=3045174 RepID=UPI0024B4825D|nr:hypothetical protein [Marinobacter sp. CHS3-4]MDI9244469.1 hypothetical protein [Marinobacter sp. CHS3-4]